VQDGRVPQTFIAGPSLHEAAGFKAGGGRDPAAHEEAQRIDGRSGDWFVNARLHAKTF
jgi:hypothetical protein